MKSCWKTKTAATRKPWLYVTPEQLAARAHGVERQEAAKAHKREKGKQPIAEQLKAAQREAQADRGQDIPKRSAPDRGER